MYPNLLFEVFQKIHEKHHQYLRLVSPIWKAISERQISLQYTDIGLVLNEKLIHLSEIIHSENFNTCIHCCFEYSCEIYNKILIRIIIDNPIWKIGMRSHPNLDVNDKGMFYSRCGLAGACRGGHMALVQLMIPRIVNGNTQSSTHGYCWYCHMQHMDCWILGMCGANQNNHLDIAKLMIEKGAKNADIDTWNRELRSACGKGYLEIVKLMIKNGANDFNGGLTSAFYGGNIKVIQLMIEYGADNWDGALSGACYAGNLELIKLAIEKGADDWNSGLIGACYGGHFEIIDLMLENGATNIEECPNCLTVPERSIQYIRNYQNANH